MQLDKVYEPQRFEPRWAQWWVESGIYRAQGQPCRPVFSLVIPPPNVTGSLHMGHMLEHTEIDVTVRWHRMSGDITLWLPGMDHAGIAAQMVVERQLLEQGLVRRALHPRPRPLPSRPRNLRQPIRKGPHLPRRVHGQLVPALSDRHLRS